MRLSKGGDRLAELGFGRYRMTSVRATPFDTAQLANAMGIQRRFAQKVTYCLRHMQAIEIVGKQGNALLYQLLTEKKTA